ncbi:major facilitator superfamily domain-containing protein [Blastocladiella britannica]|nr:major facilitator superfamily domain-containing protein [Blastocladiella britannica]
MGIYDGFSAAEKKNLTVYIGGIMCYKFALETLTGCMSNIVLTRYTNSPAAIWGTVVSINYACQSIGSLLVSPLIKRFPTSRVLSMSILLFGILVAIIPILEIATGGGSTGLGDEKKYKAGNWDPLVVCILFPAVGIFHGIVELIRRVIPRDIVGGDPVKLKKMDSTVHILYETAGTAGALLSRYWIGYFNYAYSLALIPIFFTGAALIWSRIANTEHKLASTGHVSRGFFPETLSIFKSFFHSVWLGLKLVCFNRSLVWLIPAYTFPLVLHRYLENVLFAHYANFGLAKGSYQQLLVSGSNFGELCGAFFVLMFADAVKTPIPWLRLDAIMLMVVWILPLATPFGDTEGWVWFLAACMIPVSFGWAAGDVSLVAYVQSRLSKHEDDNAAVSPLGSVMSFLYVAYIVIFALVNTWVGKIQDSYVADLIKKYGSAKKFPPLAGMAQTRDAMFWTAGVAVSVSAIIIFLATFIPKGSFALNPDVIGDDHEDDQIDKALDFHTKGTELDKEAREAVKDAVLG